MKKISLTLGLAGILLGHASAQNKEKQIPEFPKIENQIKSNTLDSLVKIYNTPASIQRYVAQNIEYIKDAEKFYPEINKNSVPKDFIRFPSPEKILEKKYGDCEEGFVLTAAALKKLGYETAGIIMMPKNGEAGHIFTIYQDSITKLYGTAGISVGDYISPVYNSIDSLIAGLAIKSQYDNFQITGVKVTDDIVNNSIQIDLPKQYVKDMNLTDVFGVMFKTENSQFGKLDKRIYSDGYTIGIRNTIIELKNPTEIINGPIKSAEINCEMGDPKLLSLNYEKDHLHFGDFTFFIEEDKIAAIQTYDLNRTEISGKLKSYYFDEQKKIFINHEDSKKRLSEKESQEYIDIANYFLTLMKDKETKVLWEQTKKQREIKKSNQDSLKINFPKD